MNIVQLGSGKCSNFGGPLDTGVLPQEGLSCISQNDLNEWWFRRIFQSNSSWDSSKGLARNLNPFSLYCAMRWAYGSFGGARGEILTGYAMEQVRRGLIVVSFNGKSLFAQPADWGPNTDTGRLIDLSPGACLALETKTDDIVSAAFISFTS